MRVGSLCILLAVLAAAITAGHAEPVVTKLESFNTIRSCLPFSLLIKPSGNSNEYALSVEADEAVQKALLTEVKDGVLALGTSDGFNVTTPIKVIVSLPKTELKQLEKSSAADLVVASGFEVGELQILVNGLGLLVVKGITADNIVLENTQIATVSIEGKIKNARVSSAGTSKVFLVGVTKTVEVALSGISKLVIDGAADTLSITGRASGLAQVFKTKGDCKVKGDFFLRSACSSTSPNAIQPFVPEYSCGLLVGGGLSCTADAASSSTFLSTGTSEEGTFSVGAGGSAFSQSFKDAASSSTTETPGGTATAGGFGFASATGSGDFSTLITTTSSSFSISKSGGSGPGQTSTSFSSSTTQGGDEPSSAQSTAGPGGSVSVDTFGPGASAVAVVSMPCDVDKKSLKML